MLAHELPQGVNGYATVGIEKPAGIREGEVDTNDRLGHLGAPLDEPVNNLLARATILEEQQFAIQGLCDPDLVLGARSRSRPVDCDHACHGETLADRYPAVRTAECGGAGVLSRSLGG